jgi:flagellar hook capping protein FlgD
MKSIIIILMILTMGLLFADLDIDIPFSQDIIGDDYSQVGSYNYESEWITLTNNGTSTQSYTMLYTYDTALLPAGWTFSICNPITCYMAFFNIPIELAPGQSEQLSIHIHAASAGGFDFNITLSGGDLTEAVSLDFTFNTADNVDSEDNIVVIEESVSNYPNPFNPVTVISFSLLESSPVDLEIYNSRGELVRSMVDGIMPSGENLITWDGTDDMGTAVSSGIYFYKIKAGSYTSTRKMMLMK